MVMVLSLNQCQPSSTFCMRVHRLLMLSCMLMPRGAAWPCLPPVLVHLWTQGQASLRHYQTRRPPQPVGFRYRTHADVAVHFALMPRPDAMPGLTRHCKSHTRQLCTAACHCTAVSAPPTLGKCMAWCYEDEHCSAQKSPHEDVVVVAHHQHPGLILQK